MIYFLFGEDTYRLKEKLKEIIEGYKKVHKNGLNFKFVDFSKKEDGIEILNNLKNDMRQASMFQEKKLVIIGNPFLNADTGRKIVDDFKDIEKSNDIFVFFQEGGVKKNTVLFKFLSKSAKCQEFSFLSGLKLKNWAKKQFEKYGGKISDISLAKLLNDTGNDLWQLDNEIKKLVSFKSGKEIGLEDIELLVRSRAEADIFKTIDAISQKDKKTALKLLHKHLDKGDSPLYLLSMINYQFRNLIVVKDLIERRMPYNMIAKKSGLHPFVVRKNYYQAPQFSMAGLKKIYQRIFQVDLDIKTGRIDPIIALDLLIAEI
jgi:DNA polymerase III subunit delta